MQHAIKCFLLIGLSIIALIPAGAQSIGPAAPDVAGGSKKISGITHEFAIGQVIDGETYLSGLLIATAGVLQPVPFVRGPDGEIGSTELQIFPDPVVSTIFLQPAFGRGGKLTYSLYDAAGALIMSREAVLADGSERQELGVNHIAGGQYLLRVTWVAGKANPKISGYKILKMW